MNNPDKYGSKPLLEEPERPGDDECCGGGSCDPCVWDYYYAQMARWKEQQAANESADSE